MTVMASGAAAFAAAGAVLDAIAGRSTASATGPASARR